MVLPPPPPPPPPLEVAFNRVKIFLRECIIHIQYHTSTCVHSYYLHFKIIGLSLLSLQSFDRWSRKYILKQDNKEVLTTLLLLTYLLTCLLAYLFFVIERTKYIQ